MQEMTFEQTPEGDDGRRRAPDEGSQGSTGGRGGGTTAPAYLGSPHRSVTGALGLSKTALAAGGDGRQGQG